MVEAAELLRGNIADVERQVIGLDHMVVGKRLAERWQLPAGDPRLRLAARAAPAGAARDRQAAAARQPDHAGRRCSSASSTSATAATTRSRVPRPALLEAVGLTAGAGGRGDREAGRADRAARRGARASARPAPASCTSRRWRRRTASWAASSGSSRPRTASSPCGREFFDALSQFQAELRPTPRRRPCCRRSGRRRSRCSASRRSRRSRCRRGRTTPRRSCATRRATCFESSLIDLPGMSEVTGGASVAESVMMAEAFEANATAADWVGPGAEPADGTDAAPATAEPPHIPHPVPGDGPVLPAGDSLEWFVGAISPQLPHDKRFWVCLEADGACIGGVVWGAQAGEAQRLSPQVQELVAIANGWGLAPPRRTDPRRGPHAGRAARRGQPPAAQRPGRDLRGPRR